MGLRKARYVSLGIRSVVNVEALNMVESVGNLVRHRVVPYVVPIESGRYVLRWVPAVSGEALAHAYQSILADIALERGLGVCYWCSRHEFIKHFDLRFIDSTKDKVEYAKEELELAKEFAGKGERLSLSEIERIESTIVKLCTVEDVGGFLVQQGPTKRTSRFYFSYMVPTEDSVASGAVALDNQFFVRHAPRSESLRPKERRERGEEQQIAPAQAPYYVQVGSALYAYTFALDIDGVGVSSVTGSLAIEEDLRKRRMAAALDALKELLDSRSFGAKLTRFSPIQSYECIVAVASRNLALNVSPPTKSFRDFVLGTIHRVARALRECGDDTKARVLLWSEDSSTRDRLRELADEAMKHEEVKGVVGEGTDAKLKVEIVESYSPRDLVDRIKGYLGLSQA